MLVHVCKIFHSKPSFQILFPKCLLIVAKELWTLAVLSSFRMVLLKKTPLKWQKSFSSSYSLTISSKQKKKKKKKINENTEHHSIFTSFNNQLFWKHQSSIFLLFGSWSLVLYLYVWVKLQFFQWFQPDNLRARSTFARKR